MDPITRSITALQLGTILGLALVASGCEPDTAAPMPEPDPRPGIAASLPEPYFSPGLADPAIGEAVIVIDDFKTGGDVLETSTIENVDQTQTGNGIIGGHRCMHLAVTTNPFERRATTEIREGEHGYLALDTAVGIHQVNMMMYGYDDACGAVGLDLSLEDLAYFRIEFAAMDEYDIYGAIDQGTTGAIVVFTDSGNASAPLPILGTSRTWDVHKDEFSGDVDWGHVQQIVLAIQSGGPVPAMDYVLDSFTAVTATDP